MVNKILVCEDDPVLCSIIQFKLERDANNEVIKVNNGKEAIKAINKIGDLDLIISDIHMPFISGMQLLEYLRKDLRSEIPFMILSSEGLESTVMAAFDLGVTDFLTKPFSPGELSVRVSRLLLQLSRSPIS